MRKNMVIWGVIALFSWHSAFAQSPPPKSSESHKYRTILTIAGAAGGFALGLYAGFVAFDDAINSEKKVSLTAAASAAGGAVGGYFLGRALDKRKKAVTTTQFGSWPSARSATISDQTRDSFEDFHKSLRMRISPALNSRPDPCAFYRRLKLPPVTFADPESGGNMRPLKLAGDPCGQDTRITRRAELR